MDRIYTIHLTESKMSIIDRIRERQREGKKEPSSSLTLEQILRMRLSELAQRNIALRIYSEVLGCEIWMCSTTEMGNQLREDDPAAVIYIATELRNLCKLQPSPEDLRALHNTKTVFPGSKIVDTTLKKKSDESDRT